MFKNDRFKYLIDYKKHVKIAKKRLDALGDLDGKKILDLGTGAGYLPYLAKKRGAIVMGVNPEWEEFYDYITEDLGVKTLKHTIAPLEALPFTASDKWDIITAYQCCFHKLGDGRKWGVLDWQMFLNRIFNKHLVLRGLLVIQINHPEVLERALIDTTIRHKWSGNTVRIG